MPTVDEDALEDVRLFLELLRAKAVKHEVPFGLAVENARFTKAGALDRGRAQGLNCSTFVLLVFERVGCKLVDASTWDERDAKRRSEDEGVQKAIVSELTKSAPEHAARLERDVGCTRFRPEEIAAASGMGLLPVRYADAEPAGRIVLKAMGVIK